MTTFQLNQKYILKQHPTNCEKSLFEDFHNKSEIVERNKLWGNYKSIKMGWKKKKKRR